MTRANEHKEKAYVGSVQNREFEELTRELRVQFGKVVVVRFHILTPHIVQPELKEKFDKQFTGEDRLIRKADNYDGTMAQADVYIGLSLGNSDGLGFETAMAIYKHKIPAYIMRHEIFGPLPTMYHITDPRLSYAYYNDANLEDQFNSWADRLPEIRERADTVSCGGVILNR